MKTKAEILAFEDLKTDDIDVPEWETKVRIRQLSLPDLLEIELISDYADKAAMAVIAGVIDPETGDKMFSKEDFPRLRVRNPHVLVRLSKAISDLGGRINDQTIEAEVKN